MCHTHALASCPVSTAMASEHYCGIAQHFSVGVPWTFPAAISGHELNGAKQITQPTSKMFAKLRFCVVIHIVTANVIRAFVCIDSQKGNINRNSYRNLSHHSHCIEMENLKKLQSWRILNVIRESLYASNLPLAFQSIRFFVSISCIQNNRVRINLRREERQGKRADKLTIKHYKLWANISI